jgi:hypothetical protein
LKLFKLLDKNPSVVKTMPSSLKSFKKISTLKIKRRVKLRNYFSNKPKLIKPYRHS